MKGNHVKSLHVRVGALVAGMSLLFAAPAFAQGAKPAEIKLGITTFSSGPASVFGVPAKAAAEQWIEDFNAAGGVNGVKITPVFIDEGLGGDKLLTEYRRVVQERGVKVMLSAISSGNCNIVAPVAEDLKVLNVMWDCGTEKLLEDRRYKYVVRTQANAVTEMVATVVYLLKTKPDFKTIAVVNQDYAWGRDSWEIFRNTLQALKPEVKVVAELFPKFGAPDFSTEISRLQALKPDVILSTSWGGDLDTFVRQAGQRGLMKSSLFVLPLAESSAERLGAALPEGVIIGGRGDHYFLHPELKDEPKHKAFVEKFRARTKKSGVILNVGSVAGIRPRPGLTWYNSSKGAVNIMSKSMAAELGPDNIRVNSICPVMGATGLLDAFMGMPDTPENRRKFIATVPMGRLAEPQDIANAALYLASDEANCISGVEFPVDGGRTV